MLYTKIQPRSFLVSEEEISKCLFLPYMGMVAVLFNNAEPLNKIVNTPLTEGPM